MSPHTTPQSPPADGPGTGAPGTSGPGTGGFRRAAGGLVTQQQAAALAGCSKDTVARARRSGRLSHARLIGGRWMIPLDDLATAGLAQPDGIGSATEAREIGDDAGRGGPVELELARAQARIGALEDLLARQDDELAFLRQLAADTLARKAS